MYSNLCLRYLEIEGEAVNFILFKNKLISRDKKREVLWSFHPKIKLKSTMTANDSKLLEKHSNFAERIIIILKFFSIITLILDSQLAPVET